MAGKILSELLTVLHLADELTAAVDMEAEDIGGHHRGRMTILRDLGPAVDAAKKAVRDADPQGLLSTIHSIDTVAEKL